MRRGKASRVSDVKRKRPQREAFRRNRREAERPLPERPRLTPMASVTEDFRPHVGIVVFPRHQDHSRTTLMGDRPAQMAYVAVLNPGQLVCVHTFSHLDRFGNGECAECMVVGWSKWWVADDFFGDDTGYYAAEWERQWRKSLNAEPGRACLRVCQTQCDDCHDWDNCRPGTHRVGDLLLCDDCLEDHAAVATTGSEEPEGDDLVEAIVIDLFAPAKRRRQPIPQMERGVFPKPPEPGRMDDPVIS